MSISYTPSTRSFLISGHVTTHSRKLPFKSANSPFAEWWRIADRKHPLPIPLRRFFLAEWYFVTKLGPQVSLSPVPFFGVNKMHHLSRMLAYETVKWDFALREGVSFIISNILRWHGTLGNRIAKPYTENGIKKWHMLNSKGPTSNNT
jgi:hypothetical protein